MGRTTVRRRAWRPVVGALGVTMIGLGVVATATAQEGQTAFVGLTALAQSDGVGHSFGDPSAQPYPVAAAQMNHTEATISTGPSGYALASTAWPGPLVANAGSLGVLLGAPPQAGQANYAGRAEAFSPAGPNDASLPGMRAHSADGVSEASAGSEDVATESNGAEQSTGNSSTLSRSSFDGSVLTAASESVTSDIDIGGVITIGSVRTFATATTDGVTASAEGATRVSGVEVGGQPATVDEEGVRFSDPVAQAIGENLLANFGMEMFVAAPRTSVDAASAEYHAGALVVLWEPPESGQLFIYHYGGSDAIVSARTIDLAVPPPPTVPTPTSASAPAAPTTRPPTTAPPLTTRPTTPQAAPTPTTPAAADPGFAPISFVRNLSWWPYVLGAAFVVAASVRLKREQEALSEATVHTSTCPLEMT